MNFFETITLNKRRRKFGNLKTDIAACNFGVLNSKPLDPSKKRAMLDFLSDPKQMAGLDIDDCSSGYLRGPLIFFSIIANDYDIYEKVCELGADKSIIYNSITVPELILTHADDSRFFDELKTIVRNGDPDQLWTKPPVVLICSRLCLEEKKKKENKQHITDRIYGLFDFLISVNIDPDETFYKEKSTLMAAMDLHDTRLFEYLLKNGADKTKKYYIEKLDKKLDAFEYLELKKDEIPKKEYSFFSGLLNE